MCDVTLKPDERLDDLLCGGKRIIQNTKEFCFSIDAVLLAHYPKCHKNWRVLDLGTGTGVMPLLMADEVKEIHAVELNPVMADLARRNVILNKLEEKIFVAEGDYRGIKDLYKPESFDLVIANPPYRPLLQGQLNNLSGVARARHEITATLADVVAAACYALKYHGRFAMVHLPERIGEIMVAMHENHIEPKRMQLVYPFADKEPNLVLLEAYKNGRPRLQVDKPLIVYEKPGVYSRDICELYGDGRKA